ncbi:hypothetical protein [Acinetobacter junii]|uniref:hypothetical protein n=1 Tax=Acinetobacter junii TaxID=40215 RepID=UPI000A94DDF8|nr:hypothetical protein [Acinetobacter junii]
MKNIQLISLVAITSLGLVACGGGSSADNNSNNTGTLNVSLTDNCLWNGSRLCHCQRGKST